MAHSWDETDTEFDQWEELIHYQKNNEIVCGAADHSLVINWTEDPSEVNCALCVETM